MGEHKGKKAPHHEGQESFYSGDISSSYAPTTDFEHYRSDITAHETLTWSVSEHVAPKALTWYLSATVVGLIVSALVALATRDIASSATVLLALVVLLAYAARKPSEQAYELRADTIRVGKKEYNLHLFKSFSVDENNSQTSVVLLPLKRFMPPLVIPLEEKIAEQAVKVLTMFLPFEQHKTDLIDALVRKIRL